MPSKLESFAVCVEDPVLVVVNKYIDQFFHSMIQVSFLR